MSFKNRRIIVAGGSGLIGSAIVEQLKMRHAEVLIIDKRDGVDLFDMIDTAFGDAFHGFVNATYPDSYSEHYNLFVLATKAACDGLTKHGGGSVVNLSSIYGLVGTKPDIYPDTNVQAAPIEYDTVKAAIIGLSRGAATRYGSKGVRVNCVAPGGVFDGQGPGFVENYCKRVPLGRMANPHDIAGVVVFLLSDDAGYVTGQTLAVDGGLTAQ